MRIVGIDTSCDDTCISIVDAKSQGSNVKSFEILSNVVSSQVKLHRRYGGVYPSLAKREHQRNLPIVLKKGLKEAGFKIFNFTTPREVSYSPPSRLRRAPSFSIFKQIPKAKIPNINFIAVTVGPGLDPCLWTGINFAKNLARQWNLPIIPINHIESHILANFLGLEVRGYKLDELFPAICLVVSGGHTQLILMTPVRPAKVSSKFRRANGAGKNWNYKIIGETRDDAAGECFDKTARILGLPYPGGPAIAAEAAKFSIFSRILRDSIKLPRPMINSKDYDFSFSGLKTAVLYDFKSRPKKERGSKAYIRVMAREIQQAIIDVLIRKTLKAAKDFKAKSIILGGGVAANNELRKQFNYKLKTMPRPETKFLVRGINYKLNFLVPPKEFCTDNAAMVALAGYFNRKKATKNYQKIKALANLRIN